MLFLGVLVGCDQAALMKKLIPAENEASARRYVNLLRQNNFDQIEKETNASIKGPNNRRKLVTMAAMFTAQEPTSVKVVGFRKHFSGDSRTTSISLEYEFPDRWLLVEVVTQTTGGVDTLLGIHVTPLADSLENLNRFTFVDKGASQYTIFFLAVLAALLTLYAFVLCIKTKIGKKKWLWLILVLVGAGKLGVDWTTGQLFFAPLFIQLPPAGAVADLYGAWFVFVSMPVGAIVFLALRNKLLESFQQGSSARANAAVSGNT